MPTIQWQGLPLALRDHLFDRLRERKITAEDLYALNAVERVRARASVDTQNRPLRGAGRDVDEGAGVVFLRRDEQRLEQEQKTTGFGAWPAGLVAEADRGGDLGPSRDGERLFEGRRCGGAWPWPAAESPAKTGHYRGVSTDPGQ